MPVRVRPGWTLPIAAVGALTLGVGWWQYYGVETQRTACELIGAMSALSGSHPSTSCAAIRSRQLLGAILIGIGLLELVVGSLAASRRGLKAARQGSPWPLRRLFLRCARAVDSRLPGYRASRPRISQAWFAAGAFIAVVYSVVGIASAWNAHTKSVRHHRYEVAQHALQVLTLPVGVRRDNSLATCPSDVDTLCARSAETPGALTAELSALLKGKTTSAICDVLGGPTSLEPCPVTIVGKIAGYPAIATVFRHLVIVKSGKPPAGATPVSPKMKTLYVDGSDIAIGLAGPA